MNGGHHHEPLTGENTKETTSNMETTLGQPADLQEQSVNASSGFHRGRLELRELKPMQVHGRLSDQYQRNFLVNSQFQVHTSATDSTRDSAETHWSATQSKGDWQ